MTIYEIYDEDDTSISLITGTLNECKLALEQWVDDNNDDAWEYELFPQYPKLESFLSNPQKFIDTYGDTEIEIYVGWTLKPIYTIRESEDNITINKLELASILADRKLEANWMESIKIYVDEDADELTYTDEAQDIFNEYYDEYLTLIESCKA